MTDSVKKPDESQHQADSEDETDEVFERQQDELEVARELVMVATDRVRRAVTKEPSAKVLAEIRAAQDRLRRNLVRLAAATDAVMMSKHVDPETRNIHKEQERKLERMVDDVEFDIEAYLRENDPNAFEDGASVLSNSIQHDKQNDPKNSTMVAAAQKTSWKELLQRVPKFDGDPTKFRRWKDAFSLHVDQTQMDDLEKFELMLKMVNEKVARCIASLDVSAENYAAAKKKIFEAYGDICMAEDQHVDNIVEACRRKDLHDNRNFVTFVSDVAQSIESLVGLGNTYKGMSVFPTRLILRALPYDRKQRFDDAYAMQDEDIRECRLKALIDFLNAEQKQVSRLTLLFKNKQETRQNSAERKDRVDRFSKYRSEQRKFNVPRWNPAGPTGSDVSSDDAPRDQGSWTEDPGRSRLPQKTDVPRMYAIASLMSARGPAAGIAM